MSTDDNLPACAAPLGMMDGRIQDVQITASGQLRSDTTPAQGRLNNRQSGMLHGLILSPLWYAINKYISIVNTRVIY